jgi:hypothetical protein
MDPDVFVTIAFVCYAAFVTVGIGIGVGRLNTHNQRKKGMDEDPARSAGSSAGEARALMPPEQITRRRPAVSGRAQGVADKRSTTDGLRRSGVSK